MNEFNVPTILATAAAGGTIAAVRNLSLSGVNVRVVSSRPFSAAAWSKYASIVYRSSAETKGAAFLSELLRIGSCEPGQLLLPTSDHTAWLYSENADLLKRSFLLYQPSAEIMKRILDKKRLADAAKTVGLSVLQSWYPQSYKDLLSIIHDIQLPVLIKPRTQVRRINNDKGVVAQTTAELSFFFQKYLADESQRRHDELLEESNVILQKYVGEADQPVHSVTGFVDRTGLMFVSRHATKVLQRSRPVGVGVCFEAMPKNDLLSMQVHNLCRELGFFGVFEVEFLWSDGCWNIIDFNPRMFSQIGLDVFRGAPLPFLAYLDAVGDFERLKAEIERANSHVEIGKSIFLDKFTMAALLFMKLITSRLSRSDRIRWRTWKMQTNNVVDFSGDNIDRMPAIIHALSEVYLGILALPRFLRSTPRIAKPTSHELAKTRL